MPGSPKEIEVTVLGQKVPTILAQDGDKVFTVTYGELPPGSGKEPPDMVFKDIQTKLVATLPGNPKITNEARIKLGSYEGREYRLEVAGKAVHAQAFIVGPRLYALTCGSPPEEAQAFFRSFKINP
jgi:hypothetical protein